MLCTCCSTALNESLPGTAYKTPCVELRPCGAPDTRLKGEEEELVLSFGVFFFGGKVWVCGLLFDEMS